MKNNSCQRMEGHLSTSGVGLHSGIFVGSWRAFHRLQSGLTYASWLSAPHEPLRPESRTHRSPSIILAFTLQSVVVCCFKLFLSTRFVLFNISGSGVTARVIPGWQYSESTSKFPFAIMSMAAIGIFPREYQAMCTESHRVG